MRPNNIDEDPYDIEHLNTQGKSQPERECHPMHTHMSYVLINKSNEESHHVTHVNTFPPKKKENRSLLIYCVFGLYGRTSVIFSNQLKNGTRNPYVSISYVFPTYHFISPIDGEEEHEEKLSDS